MKVVAPPTEWGPSVSIGTFSQAMMSQIESSAHRNILHYTKMNEMKGK